MLNKRNFQPCWIKVVRTWVVEAYGCWSEGHNWLLVDCIATFET